MHGVHKPLMMSSDSTTTLDLIPPSELHLVLGATTNIFDEINKALGEN